jgi:hypothetical protein
LAVYGTRAAVIDTSAMTGNEITVRLTEEHEALAEGRYVYLRSFDSGRRLRIDGLKLFALPGEGSLGRRTEQDFEVHDEPPQPVPEEPDIRRLEEAAFFTGDAAKRVAPEEADKRVSRKRVWLMRNLTAYVCANETERPAEARLARTDAAQLWAELSEAESAIGCTACLSRAPEDCEQWFLKRHGMGRPTTESERERKRRALREQLEAGSEERTRFLREQFDQSCCRINKKTGAKDCGGQHCKRAYKARHEARMAHTLRRMHERARCCPQTSTTTLACAVPSITLSNANQPQFACPCVRSRGRSR